MTDVVKQISVSLRSARLHLKEAKGLTAAAGFAGASIEIGKALTDTEHVLLEIDRRDR
jgi:hypothetical protein